MKKKMKRILSAVILFTMISSLVSCSIFGWQRETEETVPLEIPKSISALELSAGYAREAEANVKINAKTKNAVAQFGMSVFKGCVSERNKNYLFSPLSAISCLALMTNGAAKNTLTEIEDLLGCDIDTLNEGLLAYSDVLLNADSPVNLANSIWIKNDGSITVNKNFLQKNANFYGAQIYSAPFDGTTLEDINSWGYNNTNKLIPDILDEIDSEAIMYLINALSFEAEWQDKYMEHHVRNDLRFKNYDKSEATVTRLSSKERNYIHDDTSIGFVKPYSGGKFSFVALLPNEGVDVYDYISSLDANKWNGLWNSLDQGTVYVSMPEFTCESDIDLKGIMQSLGVEDMFERTKADFTQLGTSPEGNIYCGLFKQKTHIRLDRFGTKAGSLTVGGMFPESAAPDKIKNVNLDRPFVYAIVDNENRLPLFLGCVTNLG